VACMHVGAIDLAGMMLVASDDAQLAGRM
jgi:hypothetical protein